jgi:hypothetical protein
MGQPVIVTGAAAEPADASTAFVAGATAVVAGQAAETAAAAAETAADAEATADAARETAWDAREAVSELAARVTGIESAMLEAIGDLTDLISGDVDGQGAPAVDDGAPEKVTVKAVEVTAEKGEGSEDKPAAPAPKKDRGFGSDWWFGSKR